MFGYQNRGLHLYTSDGQICHNGSKSFPLSNLTSKTVYAYLNPKHCTPKKHESKKADGPSSR